MFDSNNAGNVSPLTFHRDDIKWRRYASVVFCRNTKRLKQTLSRITHLLCGAKRTECRFLSRTCCIKPICCGDELEVSFHLIKNSSVPDQHRSVKTRSILW